jgi:hypothetical protein
MGLPAHNYLQMLATAAISSPEADSEVTMSAFQGVARALCGIGAFMNALFQPGIALPVLPLCTEAIGITVSY